MQFAKPSVFLLAETGINDRGLNAFLKDAGASEWSTDAVAEGEELIEVAGRLCYRSFKAGLNPNVTKVREGNEKYIANMLDSGHGSVLEHASISFAFTGVSRVFTHELVRHRIGSPSQESLRYVRLDNLRAYYPEIGFGPEAMGRLYDALPESGPHKEYSRDDWAKRRAAFLQSVFENVFREAEMRMALISEVLGLDTVASFEVKKAITSAMRRMVPDGLATAIIYTCNMRSLRDIIWRRTSRHAEEEIRLVFAEVFNQVKDRYPAIFQDATVTDYQGIPEVSYRNLRV